MLLENRKNPSDESVTESKFAPAAEMVHFLTAPVYKFHIGLQYICHINVINISYTNNLKRDHLEIQNPNFENSRLGLTVSVHER